MTDQPTEALLNAARNGDRQAVEALLQQEQSRIFRFGMNMCGNPADAGDIAQETMLAVARSLPDYRAEGSFSTWLFTIARRFCMRKRRQGRSVAAAGGADVADEEIASPQAGPEEAMSQAQLGAILESAIATLSPEDREVLVLRDVEGLKASEVAAVLSLSESAVKSRLHRARLAVREQVAPAIGRVVPESARSSACPNVLSLYSQHLEDEITPQVCDTMSAHLETCDGCHRLCDSLKHSLALCSRQTAEVPEDMKRRIRESVLGVVQAVAGR